MNKEETYDILSQEEINNLLEIVEDDDKPCSYKDYKQIILYDFKRHNLIGKKQLIILKKMYDKLSIQFKNNLKEYLNTNSNIEVSLHCVDTFRYDEILMNLHSLSWQKPLSINKNSGLWIFNIDSHIARSIVMQMLNSNNQMIDERTMPISNIENNLLIACLKKCFLNAQKDIWQNYIDFDSIFLLSNENFLIDYINPYDEVISIVLELIIGNNSGMINILLPIDKNYNIIQMLKD